MNDIASIKKMLPGLVLEALIGTTAFACEGEPTSEGEAVVFLATCDALLRGDTR